MTKISLEHFKEYFYDNADLGVSVDISRLNFPDNFWEEMEPRFQDAFREMADLENGAIANADENRIVGHYWLRAPELAPGKWGDAIRETVAEIKHFAQQIHQGTIAPESGGKFENLLVIGIGGSALGPELVANALTDPHHDKLTPFFFDNSDPGGMDRTLAQIGDGLAKTLVVVISKSGGTKETRNGMLEAHNAFNVAGLHFGHHAAAITGDSSALDKIADSESWLARFPMWDWVGGRTSELSAVGLLPAALQGFDIDAMLDGAAKMDAAFVGKLIALFERTVGLYGSLVNVNAYHQPGVEAGKKAASGVIELQLKVPSLMEENSKSTFTAQEIADKIGSDDTEMIFHLLRHLAANGRLEKVGDAGLDAGYRAM